MSKSDVLDGSRINLTDDPDTIVRKLRKAVTDARGAVTYDPGARPGVSNLVDLYAAVLERPPEACVADFAGMNTLQFKEHVAAALISAVDPIRVRYRIYGGRVEREVGMGGGDFSFPHN